MFSATNETFRIKHSIYVITCAGCSHNYIGEARDVLRNRVIVHKQQIRDLHVYLHPGDWGRGYLGKFFSDHVPLASPNPYPIVVYSVANHKPHPSHF